MNWQALIERRADEAHAEIRKLVAEARGALFRQILFMNRSLGQRMRYANERLRRKG